MKKIIKLALTDFKLVFRDTALRAFLVFPVILFGVFLYFLPWVLSKYEFLESYLPVFLMVAVVENTQMFSFIGSMVLIDEKETNVAKVYGVVPLTKVEYLVSRLLIPYAVTVSLNIVLLKIQPYFAVSWLSNLIISTLTALIVPLYILTINSLAKNRMEAMVYVKALNMLVLLPFASFFIPENFKFLFGIFPVYWVLQVIDKTTENLPVFTCTSIGFVFFGSLIILVSKKFIKNHFY